MIDSILIPILDAARAVRVALDTEFEESKRLTREGILVDNQWLKAEAASRQAWDAYNEAVADAFAMPLELLERIEQLP